MLIDEVERWKVNALGINLVEAFIERRPSSTSTVARKLWISDRQVERRARKLTGISPKQLACLSRFQSARDAIWADPTIDLARLAVDAGYSDQPHMTRQFRRYAGQTPAQFRAKLGGAQTMARSRECRLCSRSGHARRIRYRHENQTRLDQP